ncbi:MAG: hypothetical protein RLY21_1826 [Planctomycetota bacterium]|jgi:hypothetical protein
MTQIGIAWSEKIDGVHGRIHLGTGRHAGRTGLVVAVLALGLGCARAEAALIASWNLNALDPATGVLLPASSGVGTLDCTGLGAGLGLMQGTTLGAQPGEAAGNALAVVGTTYNQASFRIEVATDGFTDLAFSFATRRSSTGFASNRIDYWSGLGWRTLASFSSNATAWELQSHSLASLDSASPGYLTLRLVIDGATGSTGSIRFDNLAVTGTPVPAPAGAIALLGFAGCVARRRRR